MYAKLKRNKELFWVKILKVRERKIMGKLTQNLKHNGNPEQKGDIIRFNVDNIIELQFHKYKFV